MRKINIEKLKAIKTALLDLTLEEGISNLTTAKIAKRANVSPATIYLHYEDKIDLLSRIYEEVKIKLHEGLSEIIEQETDLEIKIEKVIIFSVNKYKKNPKEAFFVKTLWNNQELLDEKAIQFGKKTNNSLSNLYNEINKSELFVNTSTEILDMFLSIPTMVQTNENLLSEDLINQLTTMIIKGIKK